MKFGREENAEPNTAFATGVLLGQGRDFRAIKDGFIGGIYMIMRKKIEVRYVNCPDMEDGRIGFCRDIAEANDCMRPRYPYRDPDGKRVIGFCHIENHAQLENLARQVGFMTAEEYKKKRIGEGKKNWRQMYIIELIDAIGEKLMHGGVEYDYMSKDTGEVELILWKCPPAAFQRWKGKPPKNG